VKPRVMFSAGGIRVVRTADRWFVVERAESRDAMGRTRWARIEGQALAERAGSLVQCFGMSMVRREKAARNARRRRGGRR
jgi:hypothetical protein